MTFRTAVLEVAAEEEAAREPERELVFQLPMPAGDRREDFRPPTFNILLIPQQVEVFRRPGPILDVKS